MDNTTDNHWGTCLVVAQAGHVWVAHSVHVDRHFYHLGTARIIREWGTDRGLNQLVNGPTKNSKLDAPAPVVSIPHHALIALIPCNDDRWAAHF